MANQLRTIQCPKCGQLQQVDLRPDTYRCPYCGTKDFFGSDESTLLVQQGPPVALSQPVTASAPARRLRWALILLGLLLGCVGAYYWGRYSRASAEQYLPLP